MLQAINISKENENKLYIVSDANSFFIDSILKAYKIENHFTEIHTNPSFWKDGKLYIERYHNNEARPSKYLSVKSLNNTKTHQCSNCNPNICKGKIVKEIMQKNINKINYIYIGDGSGYKISFSSHFIFTQIFKKAIIVHALSLERMIMFL